MREILKKAWLPCMMTILIAVLLFIYWGNKKDVWFCDEVYTYEIANAMGQPNVLAESRNWISGYDVKSYLGAPYRWLNLNGMLESFPTDNVPLYYSLLRIASVVFVGTASKWIGLLVNLIFFIPFVAGVWLCIYKLCKRRGIASLFTIAISFHPLLLSQMTAIRMYCPFLVFVFFSYLLVVNLNLEEKNKWYHWGGIWLVVTGGLLTHYHYWLFIAMLSGFYCLYLMLKRKWRMLLPYVGCMLLTLLTATAVFPQWMQNIRVGHGGAGLAKMFDFSMLGKEVLFMLEKTAYLLSTDTCHWVLVTGISLIIFGVFVWNYRKKTIFPKVFIGVLAAVFTIFLIGHTVGEWSARYFWSPVTLLFMLLLYMFYMDLRCLAEWVVSRKKKDTFDITKVYGRVLAAGAVCLLAIDALLVSSDIENIMYLANRPAETRDTLKEYADVPWMIYTDTAENTLNFKLYCSFFDFMIPEKICRIGSDDLPKEDEVLKEADEMLLYIDESDMELEHALKYINSCKGADRAEYEYLAESTYCTVYRIWW